MKQWELDRGAMNKAWMGFTKSRPLPLWPSLSSLNDKIKINRVNFLTDLLKVSAFQLLVHENYDYTTHAKERRHIYN